MARRSMCPGSRQWITELRGDLVAGHRQRPALKWAIHDGKCVDMCYRDATGWKLRPDTLAFGRPTSIPVVGTTRLRSGLAGRRHSEGLECRQSS
jgi:hypothetical protein